MRYATNDLEPHWLPFTANKAFKKEPRLLVEGKGLHLKSHTGHDVIDAVSGLFCSPAGHSRTEIAEAVERGDPYTMHDGSQGVVVRQGDERGGGVILYYRAEA